MSESQQIVVRVKRRRNEEPTDTLCIVEGVRPRKRAIRKKQGGGLISAFSALNTGNESTSNKHVAPTQLVLHRLGTIENVAGMDADEETLLMQGKGVRDTSINPVSMASDDHQRDENINLDIKSNTDADLCEDANIGDMKSAVTAELKSESPSVTTSTAVGAVAGASNSTTSIASVKPKKSGSGPPMLMIPRGRKRLHRNDDSSVLVVDVAAVSTGPPSKKSAKTCSSAVNVPSSVFSVKTPERLLRSGTSILTPTTRGLDALLRSYDEAGPPTASQQLVPRLIDAIKGGANIDHARTSDGLTALMIAVIENDLWAVNILLQRGANTTLLNADARSVMQLSRSVRVHKPTDVTARQILLLLQNAAIRSVEEQGESNTENDDFVMDVYVLPTGAHRRQIKANLETNDDKNDLLSNTEMVSEHMSTSMPTLELQGIEFNQNENEMIFSYDSDWSDLAENCDDDPDSNDEDYFANDYPDEDDSNGFVGDMGGCGLDDDLSYNIDDCSNSDDDDDDSDSGNRNTYAYNYSVNEDNENTFHGGGRDVSYRHAEVPSFVRTDGSSLTLKQRLMQAREGTGYVVQPQWMTGQIEGDREQAGMHGVNISTDVGHHQFRSRELSDDETDAVIYTDGNKPPSGTLAFDPDIDMNI